MEKNKELVYKPNQTIMVTNKTISATQRKAYNVILYTAQNDLKNNNNQTLFEFNITELKKKAGIKATDNWHLKNDIKQLSDISLETVKDNGDWDIFKLISYAGKKDDLLVIEIPLPIRQALINNDFYTALDLLIIKSLEGKYAVILYEVAIRYKKTQIPELSIKELRELTGTEDKRSYDNYTDFSKRVLTPAIEEINEKTDIKLKYIPITRGKKTIAVKFDVKLKDQTDEAPAELKQMEGQVDVKYYKMNQLVRLFFDETGVEFPMDQLSHLVEKKGYDFVLEYFIHANRFNYKKTPVGFFIKAISEEWSIPVQKRNPIKSNIPQHDNYEQRNYPKDYLDNFFNSKS